MSGPLLTGALWGANNSLREQATSYAHKIDELREYRRQDAAIIKQQAATIEQHEEDYAALNVHYRGMEAERDFLLDLLDKAYGQEDNPARKEEDDSARIPVGPRKGQSYTVRDAVHMKALVRCWKNGYQNVASSVMQLIDHEIFK